jgi:hypothetical protein
MRRWLSLLAVPAFFVGACGGDDGEPAAASSSSSPSSTPAAPSGAAEATLSIDAAVVELEDQSGDGASAVVHRVVIPQDGFVVVSVHDGAVLGSLFVGVGVSGTLAVPLQPPITRDTELDATLYLDSDGNGAFDAAVDVPVPAPDQPQDHDQDMSHDVVSDDAHYRIG